jgi:hypothetical protein
MKRADKTSVTERDFNELISEFSENEILSLNAMQYVRGGDGVGNGGGDLIILPPKPPTNN